MSYPSHVIQEREQAIMKVLEKYNSIVPPGVWEHGDLLFIAKQIEDMIVKEFTPTGHGGGGAPYKLERRNND
jgi:hypothetical protein